MDRILKKQLSKLEYKEALLIKKRALPASRNSNPLSDKIERHIPEGVKNALETAFCKGFHLVFEKGFGIIEKTYDKEQLLLDHKLFELGYTTRPNRKNLSRISRQAGKSTTINGFSAIIEGSVLGLLGIGLPDIPLFIGMLLKNIYEISLSYGYDYQNTQERYYILKLIAGALASPEDFFRLNNEIDVIGNCLNSQKAVSFQVDAQIKETSRALASEMIAMKFIQGLPIVGAVGGVSNFVCYKKIMDYAKLKYQKRYLLSLQ